MAELPEGPVKIVVGAVIAAGLAAAFYYLLPLSWFIFSLFLLAIEAWALFNPYAHDTISEVIWALSERPMVPFLGGLALGWGLQSGFITSLWVAMALGFLAGHFWFQRKGD